jgi:hypothetical protein
MVVCHDGDKAIEKSMVFENDFGRIPASACDDGKWDSSSAQFVEQVRNSLMKGNFVEVFAKVSPTGGIGFLDSISSQNSGKDFVLSGPEVGHDLLRCVPAAATVLDSVIESIKCRFQRVDQRSIEVKNDAFNGR